jgi:Zn-dependent protease/predicted transcriptional regulator
MNSFGKPITLFKILGFSIRMNVSWIFIAILITWSLAKGVFPVYYPGLSESTYWLMGLGGMIGLFISIIFHELCHSLVARRFDLPMKGITLFIFGGVAEMTEEPKSAKAEFLMAIAGPASSILVALVCFAVGYGGRQLQWPESVNGTILYLGVINIILVVFNLLPGFPLDGGRVFRSILWYWKGNLRWATRVAASFGSGLGTILIVLGVISVLTGNFIGGMWWFLIGMFLRSAANMSYQQVLMRETLKGEPVARFMNTQPITVSPDMSVEELVDHYIYKYHYKMYPVVQGDRILLGCVTVGQVKEIPRTQWPHRNIRDIAQNCSVDNSVDPKEDAMEALAKMSRTGLSRLMVVAGGRLEGIITLKDMLGFLSMKIEFENIRQT